MTAVGKVGTAVRGGKTSTAGYERSRAVSEEQAAVAVAAATVTSIGAGAADQAAVVAEASVGSAEREARRMRAQGRLGRRVVRCTQL